MVFNELIPKVVIRGISVFFFFSCGSDGCTL